MSQIIKGRITNNAEGLVKPIMPTPPDQTPLNNAKRKVEELTAANNDLTRQYYDYARLAGTEHNPNSLAVHEKQKVMVIELNNAKLDLERAQKSYNDDYAAYQQKMTTYNAQYAAWAEATAKLNNTTPEVLKAQIEAEKAKTDNAVKVAAQQATASSNKWLIIGAVVVVVIVIGVILWVKVIRKKGA